MIRTSLFRPNSLRGRLLLLGCCAVFSSAALATVLTWRAYRHEHDALVRDLQNTSRAVSAFVDQEIGESEKLLRRLAASPALARGDWATFHTQASLLSLPREKWIVVLDLSGQELLNTNVPLGAPLRRLSLTAAELAAWQTGRAHLTGLVSGQTSGASSVIALSVPVVVDGRLRYGLSIGFRPRQFLNRVDIAQIAPDYILTVLDQHGTIVARSRNAEHFVGRPATPDIVARAASQREAIVESTTLEGLPVLGAVCPAPISHWAVAIGAPLSILHESARRLILLSFTISLCTLLITAFVVWWITRSVVRDVAALLRSAEQLGRGLTADPHAWETTETATLAQAMQDMTVQLHRELQFRIAAEAALQRAQADLLRANTELDDKVRQRTASLANLVQQMEEFTYSISHDLRAPIRAVTGLSGVLLEDHAPDLKPDAVSILQRIIRSGERMDRLIVDLLAFTRVGRHEVKLAPLDPRAVILDVINDHPALQPPRTTITLPPALPAVLANHALLLQVFSNLLTNAAKFVPSGRAPRIEIRGETRDSLGRIWIIDNGIGISPSLQSRLFRIFERLHNESYEGTGIGLATARRALERMNGTIGVESDGAHGSRFWIELPLAVPVSAATNEEVVI